MGIEAVSSDSNPEDDIVALLLDIDSSDRKCLRVTFAPSGEMQVDQIDEASGSASFTPIEIVEKYEVLRKEGTWSVEAIIKLDRLPAWQDNNQFHFNVGMKTDEYNDPVAWQPLLEHDLPSFGILTLP